MRNFLGVFVIFLLGVLDYALFDKVTTPVFIYSLVATVLASILVGYYSFKKEAGFSSKKK